MMTAVLFIGLVASLFLIYIMHVRIRQLTKELATLKERMELTDGELNQLVTAIEDFKRLKIT